jgi:hypothetical protein
MKAAYALALATCAALSVAVSAQALAAAAESEPAAAAFDRLKMLEGEWRPAADPKSALRIRFYPTAGGTVLVEEWRHEGRPHSLTLYHRDGGTLLATHYCPQGNQPRMALAPADGEAIRFTFRDATDLDPATEQHQHDLRFDLDAAARVTRSEIYRDGEGGDHPSELVLERAGGDRAPSATGR